MICRDAKFCVSRASRLCRLSGDARFCVSTGLSDCVEQAKWENRTHVEWVENVAQARYVETQNFASPGLSDCVACRGDARFCVSTGLAYCVEQGEGKSEENV